MTPFAQLGQMTKQAVPAAPGYKYQKNSAGLNDPYLPQVSKVAPQSWQSAAGWGAAELGADVAAGSNPLTGVPWFAGKAIYQGLKGNWGQAATNLGMAGLSFLPGAASGAALAKGALTAGRVANTAAEVGRVASAVNKYKGVISKGQELATAGVNAVKAAPGVARAGELATAGVNAAKASGAGQAVASGVNTARTAAQGFQPFGVNVGATAWNAGSKAATGAGMLGTQMAKQAPMDFVTSKIPNNPNLLPPTAPPPPPVQMPAWQSQMFDAAQYGGMGQMNRPAHPYMK